MTGGASCSIVGCINKYTKGGISLHRFISQYVFHKTFNAIFVGISPTYPKDYWKVNWEWWCCCFLAQSAAAVSGVIWIFPPYSMNALPSEVQRSTNLISPHVRKSAYSYLSVEQSDNVGLYVSLRFGCLPNCFLGFGYKEGEDGLYISNSWGTHHEYWWNCRNINECYRCIADYPCNHKCPVKVAWPAIWNCSAPIRHPSPLRCPQVTSETTPYLSLKNSSVTHSEWARECVTGAKYYSRLSWKRDGPIIISLTHWDITDAGQREGFFRLVVWSIFTPQRADPSWNDSALTKRTTDCAWPTVTNDSKRVAWRTNDLLLTGDWQTTTDNI